MRRVPAYAREEGEIPAAVVEAASCRLRPWPAAGSRVSHTPSELP